ncbi:MAG: hypothetical protein HY730_06245 [Candidatus Tectomicrobia bacterium]|uniref:Uncharacterized protein n=1 Tax=Tectimicrobiota bacterium TaxID=2528274 RepID=A0A933LQ99_UNCTE|nr:hypothetical protein [Candidatus Tectomicrobia bacterium]
MGIASNEGRTREQDQNTEPTNCQTIAQKETIRLWKLPKDRLEVNKTCLDLAGDLTAGILLNRIILWHIASRHRSRQSVMINNKQWIARTRMDWWGDCRISPRQFDRAITILEKLKIVETAVFRYEGNPTKHIAINWERCLELLRRSLKSGL